MRTSLKKIIKRGIRTLPFFPHATHHQVSQKTDVWAIGIYDGDSPYDFYPKEGCNPVLTYKDVTDIEALYVADPFMIRFAHSWYMFFEVLDRNSRKGKIGHAMSIDGYEWHYQQIVLEEEFHLSYPYIFEWDNRFYMIPETHQVKSIRLYQAEDFPYKWKYVKTFLEGEEYVDSSIFRYANHWWLFACTGNPPFRADSLHLFSSQGLLGPWVAHPQNPIVNNNAQIARPGGRVFVDGARVIRYAQDCSTIYGQQVRAFNITHLSNMHYEERVLEKNLVLGPNGSGWNEIGMHHIDPHLVREGKWIACVDGWRWGTAE